MVKNEGNKRKKERERKNSKEWKKERKKERKTEKKEKIDIRELSDKNWIKHWNQKWE